MSLVTRVASALGIRSVPPIEMYEVPTSIIPPSRDRVVWTAPEKASRVGVAFTCVGIIATAAEQLSLDVERDGTPIASSSFVSKPDPDLEFEDWIHEIVTSLAFSGNAYLRTWRDDAGHALAARVLPPGKVHPFTDEKTGRKRFAYGDKTYSTLEIKHLRFLKMTGELLGLGPIQAAQAELGGHMDLVEASSGWIKNSGVPSGMLTTEQHLDATQRKALLTDWNAVPAGRTRLMSNGLKYDAMTINPRDAQFLESRRFSKTEIADMFGVPASLLLGVDKGASDTYANISQDWLGFVRFRLMRYVREIEISMSSLIPRGQRTRFNLEALLRSDAETRMKIHAEAIRAGVYSSEYARQIEHIPESAAPALTPSRPAPSLTPDRINA